MKFLFHSLLYGLGTCLALFLIGAFVGPLRPACDFLLSPGDVFGAHDLVSIVISSLLDVILYTALYFLLLRVYAICRP